MCTSVASRVHGTTGLPCSSVPWWERMMWPTACASSGGEAVDVLDQATDAVVAERDLAVQPAGVGEVDVLRIVRVGLELADVVQQRAGDRDVAVDARERGADRADRLGDAEAVLEQAVGVGLVVVLGGRRRAVARPQLGVLAEHALQQDPQVRLLDRGEQLADLGFHLLDPARRAVEQVLARRSSRAGGLAGHAG